MKNKLIRRTAAVLIDIAAAAAVNAIIWGIFSLLEISALYLFITAPVTLLIYFAGFLISPLRATPGMLIFNIHSNAAKNKRLPCVRTAISQGGIKYYLIPESGLIFGRDPEVCSVIFAPDEKAVSRCHCCMKYNEQTGMFLLEDLGSSYGTFLSDSTQLTASKFAALADGDGFYIGTKGNRFIVGFREEKR